jgi:hypothetical protein
LTPRGDTFLDRSPTTSPTSAIAPTSPTSRRRRPPGDT